MSFRLVVLLSAFQIVAMHVGAQVMLVGYDLGGGHYQVNATNTGTTFQASSGNDTISINRVDGQPNLLTTGVTADLPWELNPAASSGDFLTFFIDTGSMETWNNGQTITLDFFTDGVTTEFTYSYLFELGPSPVFDQPLTLVAVPESGTFALIGGILGSGLLWVRRRRA